MIVRVGRPNLVFCLVLTFVVTFPIYGQRCVDENNKSDSSALTRVYAEQDWTAVEREWISFRVPKDMREVGKRCIDGRCLKYEGPSAYLNIDRSSGSFGPSFERHFATYESKTMCIGGETSLTWQYKQDSEFRSVFAILFQISDSEQLVVTYLSKSESESEIAELIFRSIRITRP